MTNEESSESSEESGTEIDLDPYEATCVYLGLALEVYSDYLATLGPEVSDDFIAAANRELGNLAYHLSQAEFFARRLYKTPPFLN